ncbi:hypothetical protein TNCV_4010541 [Trichonephila clavipes]|nr:hypothetical protein TNCV_4010541 [Trichonephila clavipes]
MSNFFVIAAQNLITNFIVLGSNSGEGTDAYECKVPVQHGLQSKYPSSRKTSRDVEPKRTVICMVYKTVANEIGVPKNYQKSSGRPDSGTE